METKVKCGITENKLILIICNLIMCRLTGGLWLFVWIFMSPYGKFIAKILLEAFLIWFTNGIWLLVMVARYIMYPEYYSLKEKEKKKSTSIPKYGTKAEAKQRKMRRQMREKRMRRKARKQRKEQKEA